MPTYRQFQSALLLISFALGAAVVLLMLLFQSFRHHFTDIVQIKSRKPRIDLILIIRRLRVRLGKPV